MPCRSRRCPSAERWMKQIPAHRRSFSIIAGIFLVGSLIYANTLKAPFVYDDEPFIVYNTNIKDLGNLPAIWHAAAVPSRFISFLSFALNYHFHGLDVAGYHLVNIGIHLINALLVYWLMLLTLRGHEARRMLAAAIALLFLTHPIQTQAVTYITQRFTSLATLFYLAAICFYASGRVYRKPIYYAGAVLSAVLAMFTKEIALTLPVAIIMYDFYFLKNNVGAAVSAAIPRGPEDRPPYKGSEG